MDPFKRPAVTTEDRMRSRWCSRAGSRWCLLGLVALGVILRLGWVAWTGWSVGDFGDSKDYLAAAAALCSEEPYPEHSSLPFFRAPGLPLVIAMATGCHPGNTVLLKLALVVLDSLSIIVIAGLAATLWRSRPVTLVSAGLAAIYPPFILWSGEIRTEPVFMLLLTTGVLLAIRGLQVPSRSQPWRLAAAGAAFSLAALTRPSALLSLPFFAAVTVLWDQPHGSRRSRRKAVLALVVGAGVLLSPWVASNWARYDELILVNDAGGYNLWRGTHPAMDRIVRSHSRDDYQHRIAAFASAIQPPAEALVQRTASSPMDRSRVWRALALERWRSQPVATARVLASNLTRYWRPWLMPLEHSRAQVAASAILILPLYVVAALGWWRLARHSRSVASLLAAWLVATWLIHAPFQVVMRFRIPYTDPILLALAAGALVRPGRAMLSKRTES